MVLMQDEACLLRCQRQVLTALLVLDAQDTMKYPKAQQAGMVKWYHTSLPSSWCGFDSRYPLQKNPETDLSRAYASTSMLYAGRRTLVVTPCLWLCVAT